MEIFKKERERERGEIEIVVKYDLLWESWENLQLILSMLWDCLIIEYNGTYILFLCTDIYELLGNFFK